MARSAATVIENNFVRGLVTEATGLNYPENSCAETWDCEFDFFGRVSRRKGFDFEYLHSSEAISKSGSAITVYFWKNVTGDGQISFVVVQIGGKLYFYNTESNSLSNGYEVGTVDLTAFAPVGAPATNLYDCQYTDGLSKLYVFHPFLENIYVTYDPDTEIFTATQYSLKIRDFEGQDDGLGVEDRPTATVGTLDPKHRYNLNNQGWPASALTSWDTGRTDMPSNADVWWTFKNSSDAFDVSTVANSGRGNTPAPKGKYILDYYNQDRNTASGLTGLTTTSSGVARTSTGVFYAGRVFYAGVNSAGYTSKILFSQTIQKTTDVGACHQANDPTSEDLFDLLPTDGGVIAIPEAGTIYKLFAMATGLVIFAQRGVWMITGSTGIGFTAVDYTVAKLSSIRTFSATSFIEVNGVPMWWNTDGIFTVQGSQGSPTPQVQSVSINTIQTFFNGIPNGSKLAAKGYFNPLSQTVQWLYRSVAPGTPNDQNTFDRILNYNVLTNAFYPWTISPGLEIHGLVVIDAPGGTLTEDLVVDGGGVQVVDGLGNDVVSYALTNTAIVPSAKFLTSYDSGGITYFTWSEARREDYIDWATQTAGVNYSSYFVTGYKLHGNAITKFQPTYTIVYHEGLGEMYIQGVWDYSLSTATGRVSTKQYLKFVDVNYSNHSRRVKIRGNGRTLQYLVKSVEGKPFTVSGWGTFETGNTLP